MTVIEWTIDNGSFGHLRAFPLGGSVAESLPSATYWRFAANCKTQTSTTPGAVTVDDTFLGNIPSCGAG